MSVRSSFLQQNRISYKSWLLHFTNGWKKKEKTNLTLLLMFTCSFFFVHLCLRRKSTMHTRFYIVALDWTLTRERIPIFVCDKWFMRTSVILMEWRKKKPVHRPQTPIPGLTYILLWLLMMICIAWHFCFSPSLFLAFHWNQKPMEFEFFTWRATEFNMGLVVCHQKEWLEFHFEILIRIKPLCACMCVGMLCFLF